MWKVVKTKVGETVVVKIKEKKWEEEKKEKKENNRSKKDGRRIRDLRWGRSSKVEGRSQEIGFSKILQVNLYLWKKNKWENANKKDGRSYNRCEEKIYTEKEEDISAVKKRERRSM